MSSPTRAERELFLECCLALPVDGFWPHQAIGFPFIVCRYDVWWCMAVNPSRAGHIHLSIELETEDDLRAFILGDRPLKAAREITLKG